MATSHNEHFLIWVADVKMRELVVECVEKPGVCDKHNVGDFFEVRNGKLYLPEGKFICIYALQSIMPLIPAKERDLVPDEKDWLPRENRISCPDPKGRLVFEIRPKQAAMK